MLLFLIIYCTVNPDEASNEDECHSWHSHHTVVDVETAILHVAAVWNYLETEDCTETEEFANETYYYEYECIAKTVSDTIDE